jgi:hypothetical protein
MEKGSVDRRLIKLGMTKTLSPSRACLYDGSNNKHDNTTNTLGSWSMERK